MTMIRSPLPARLSAFLAVGEALNFRKAAERLGIAQPALSRSIRDLERQLGFALFERSTRRVALTPAGEVLYRDGREAMQRLMLAQTRATAGWARAQSMSARVASLAKPCCAAPGYVA